ncbi:protein FAM177A1 [Clupea harengus]|uniref:Protein FAM177A1 n=1 Tax=Clupea harengus TaxID=7950 RepID=A0A6P8GQF5_CLUHA|nr:protein FAM177A1 [Clupea harengus]
MNGNLTRDLPTQETSFGQVHQSRGRRVIYFSSGETLAESDREEEDDEDGTHKEPFSQSVDTENLSWGEYSRFLGTKIGKKSLQTCEYLGEKLARLLGLHAAKYQYAIDQFHRDQKRKDVREESSGVFMEDDAEMFNLAQKKSRTYGATNPEPGSSRPTCVEHKAGHNQGYQDD